MPVQPVPTLNPSTRTQPLAFPAQDPASVIGGSAAGQRGVPSLAGGDASLGRGIGRGLEQAGASIADALEKNKERKERRQEAADAKREEVLGQSLTGFMSQIQAAEESASKIEFALGNDLEWLSAPEAESMIRDIGAIKSNLRKKKTEVYTKGFDVVTKYLGELADNPKQARAALSEGISGLVKEHQAFLNGEISEEDARGKAANHSLAGIDELQTRLLLLAAHHGADVREMASYAEEFEKQTLKDKEAADAVFFSLSGTPPGTLSELPRSQLKFMTTLVDRMRLPRSKTKVFDVLAETAESSDPIFRDAGAIYRNIGNDLSQYDRLGDEVTHGNHSLLAAQYNISHVLQPSITRVLEGYEGKERTAPEVSITLPTGETKKLDLSPNLYDLGRSMTPQQADQLREFQARLTLTTGAINNTGLMIAQHAYMKNHKHRPVRSLIKELARRSNDAGRFLSAEEVGAVIQEIGLNDPVLQQVAKDLIALSADLPRGLSAVNSPLMMGEEEGPPLLPEKTAPVETRPLGTKRPNQAAEELLLGGRAY